MRPLRDRLRAALDEQGSTRAFAVFRLLLLGTVFWYVMDVKGVHPAHVDAPTLRRVVAVVLLLSTWSAWVGFKTRLSTALVALCWGLLQLRWGVSSTALHVTRDAQLLQALVVLALSPSGRSLSLDAWLAARRARRHGRAPPPERGPQWTRWLMVTSLSILYVTAAAELADAAWLSGHTIDRFWLGRWGSSDTLARAPALLHALSVSLAWTIVALLVVVGVGLWVPRWRGVVLALGIGLHLLTWPLFGAWPMTASILACYAAITPPAWVHDWLDTVFARPDEQGDAPR